jgi:uncharacterized protein YjeT (DUF2065 family)
MLKLILVVLTLLFVITALSPFFMPSATVSLAMALITALGVACWWFVLRGIDDLD